jgi:hypothetical protein
VLTEGLVFARRNVKTLMPEKSVGRQALQLLLYSTHLTLGYFMMLVIMAYQTQLFILTVFGLSLGHLVFNIKAPVAEKPDPCCADIGDEGESDMSDINMSDINRTNSSRTKTLPVELPAATVVLSVEGMMWYVAMHAGTVKVLNSCA